jgi:hypothetical protein
MFTTNINSVNYSCSPIRNQNNQTIAYNCSSNSRTIENFEAPVIINLGQRYSINGMQQQNNSLVDNASGNPAAYTNLFAVSRKSNPLVDPKINYADFDISKNPVGNFGAYGKEWLYLVTGKDIPKNTYVTKTMNSRDNRAQVDTYIVMVNPVGITSQTVGGGSVNMYVVANTPLQTMAEMGADILNRDYNAQGVFIGKLGV